MNPVKLYSDPSHFQASLRRELADILRPFWKQKAISDDERQKLYNLSTSDFEVVEDVAAADLVVLPLTWNHYLVTGTQSRAAALVKEARKHQKPVISYISGDEGVGIPEGFEDVYVLRASGQKSRKLPLQIAEPVFFHDPWTDYPDLAHYEKASPPGKATVGFCGQATVSYPKAALGVVRTCCRNFAHYAGLRLKQPQPLYPPSLLRGRALDLLSKSSQVATKFLPRSQYRGGVRTPEERQRTTCEFYSNIAETDYTLCVRGGGNFSKRLYETLAMGRIPVLVDTDCLLPFEQEIRWTDYIVRVPQSELAFLPEKVAQHFESLGPERLGEIKKGCRELWEGWLSFGGFHRHLAALVLKKSCVAAQ